MLNSLAPVDSMGPFLAMANTPGKKDSWQENLNLMKVYKKEYLSQVTLLLGKVVWRHQIVSQITKFYFFIESDILLPKIYNIPSIWDLLKLMC